MKKILLLAILLISINTKTMNDLEQQERLITFTEEDQIQITESPFEFVPESETRCLQKLSNWCKQPCPHKPQRVATAFVLIYVVCIIIGAEVGTLLFSSCSS